MSRSRVQSQDVWPSNTEEQQFTHATIEFMHHNKKPRTTKVPSSTAFEVSENNRNNPFVPKTREIEQEPETSTSEEFNPSEQTPQRIMFTENENEEFRQKPNPIDGNASQSSQTQSQRQENDNQQQMFPMNYPSVFPGHGFVPFMAPFMHEQMTYMAVPVNLNVPLSLNGQYDYHTPPRNIHDEGDNKSSGKRKRKNRLCTHEGCTKNARGRTDFCVRHGGGTRCSVHGCEKGARPHSQLCSSHGGGHRCLFPGCNKGALAKSVYCRRHGKMAQNQRPPQTA